jgi:putative ABC transport system ATP-binding protein
VQTIAINNIVPDPIADIASKSSEIWFKEHSFTRGKHYLISAESGTGKSSFFDFLYGRRNDFQGNIIFDGKPIKSFKTKEWNTVRQQNISLVFQGFRLFAELTVFENLQLKNHLTGDYLSDEKMMQLLERLGISDKRDIPLRFISYGQQQRVAIIRAMCQPFDFLLLDEPFSHLDEVNQRIICEMVADELKERGASLILCSLGDPYFFNYDEKLKM